jgi:hypothetical protein
MSFHFEDVLEQEAFKRGVFDGIHKDDAEEALDSWMASLEAGDVIQMATDCIRKIERVRNVDVDVRYED